MSLSIADVEKIALLARLSVTPDDAPRYASSLSAILEFVSQLDQVNTDHISPMSHPLDLTQRLRDDQITETNERDLFQKIAPKTVAGLYLVPKVIAED